MNWVFKHPIDFFHYMIKVGMNILGVCMVIAAGVVYGIFLLF